jgi:hypothetical protein
MDHGPIILTDILRSNKKTHYGATDAQRIAAFSGEVREADPQTDSDARSTLAFCSVNASVVNFVFDELERCRLPLVSGYKSNNGNDL